MHRRMGSQRRQRPRIRGLGGPGAGLRLVYSGRSRRDAAVHAARQALRPRRATSYLVWGPAMVGGGYAATAGVHSPVVTWPRPCRSGSGRSR